MKVMGFCRFSWFGISDTGRSIQTEDDAMRILYDPIRLATRFHLFENLCAPALRHQTDPDFEFVVITSPEMPEQFRTRLERIVAAVPQMRLVVTNKRDIGAVMKPLVLEGTAGGTQPLASFRLDDDDAVSVNYIARLRGIARRMEPGELITFPSGIYAFQHPDGARFGDWNKPFVAAGLVRMNGPGAMQDVFRMQHLKEAERRNFFTDPKFFAYMVTSHGHNISAVDKRDDGKRVRNRFYQRTPELLEAFWTRKAASALETEYPFLTPQALVGILEDADTVVFDPDRPLPDALIQ